MNDAKWEYCEFVGTKAFEDDGGWSFEVWQAAQAALFKRLQHRFQKYGDIPYSGKEVADYLKKASDDNVSQ
jgi:hypothetical protein